MGRRMIARSAPAHFSSQKISGPDSIAGKLRPLVSLNGSSAPRGHMLTASRLDGQDYIRVGEETRTSHTGRAVTVSLWRFDCPDCGAAFVQHHRARGFDPARRVSVSGNSIPHFSSSAAAPILPARWRAPRPTRHALRVPPTSAPANAIASSPWGGQPSTAARTAPIDSHVPIARTDRSRRAVVQRRMTCALRPCGACEPR